MTPTTPAAAALPVRRKQAGIAKAVSERWYRDQQFRAIDVTAALSERVDRDKEQAEALRTALCSVRHALHLSAHLMPVALGIAVTKELGVQLDRLQYLTKHIDRAATDHREAFQISKAMSQHFEEAA